MTNRLALVKLGDDQQVGIGQIGQSPLTNGVTDDVGVCCH